VWHIAIYKLNLFCPFSYAPVCKFAVPAKSDYLVMCCILGL